MAVLEIAIRVFNDIKQPLKRGDIVTARKPVGYVGKKEQEKLLWLLVDTSISLEDLTTRLDANKCRFYIPFDLLATTGIDMGRVSDPFVKFQPFVDPDSRDGKFNRQMEPLPSSFIRERI